MVGAGLTAAGELTRSGHDVLVLEGRDRVGGRSHAGEIAGMPVDLGGAFVGPTQDTVLTLAAELGIQTTPIYHDGANLIRWRGRVRSFAAGGPTAVVPPGFWTDYGRWLHEPVGPIHGAGTETADERTGLLDGAVRSGQRAAAEVTAQVRS